MQIADELFEYIWPFCGIDALRVNLVTNLIPFGLKLLWKMLEKLYLLDHVTFKDLSLHFMICYIE